MLILILSDVGMLKIRIFFDFLRIRDACNLKYLITGNGGRLGLIKENILISLFIYLRHFLKQKSSDSS